MKTDTNCFLCSFTRTYAININIVSSGVFVFQESFPFKFMNNIFQLYFIPFY